MDSVIFLLLLLLHPAVSEYCLHSDCRCSVYSDEETVGCGPLQEVASFPYQLPPNISRVVFNMSLNGTYFPPQLFVHERWKSVRELHNLILAQEEKIIFPLPNLQTLIVRNNSGTYQIPFEFDDLTSLVTLDLSLNLFFSFKDVEKSITNKLPNLKNLYLHGIHTAIHPPHVLDKGFAEALTDKLIREIDMSFSGLVGFSGKAFENMPRLRLLNVSGTNLGFYIKMPRNVSVDIIDISHNRAVSKQQYVGSSSTDMLCYEAFSNIKCLYMHHMTFTNPIEFYMYNTSCIKTYQLREFRGNNNNIKRLDWSIRGNFSSIEIIDLSENNLEYISPSLCRGYTTLAELHLGRNRLHVMEHMPDFSILLRQFPELVYLDLSENNLHIIPGNFFAMQLKLETLLLVGNKLKILSFDTEPLLNVVLLNVSRNVINEIEKDTMASLDFISKQRKHRNSLDTNQRSFLDLSSNPLECQCNNLEFANWFLTTKAVEGKRKYCLHGDEHVLVTQERMNIIREECDYSIAKVIGLTTSVPLSSLAFIIILSCYGCKRRQKHKGRRKIIDKFKDNEEIFLVFLSFSGADDAFGSRVAYDALQEGLTKKLKMDRKLVATGVIDFKPGHNIEDEIIRCIEASDVVALCISESFIESEWCSLEGFIADREKKPILLIVKDEVMQTYRPSKYRRFLRNYKCVTWTENDGEHDVRPDWDSVCDTILKLAEVGDSNNSWIQRWFKRK